MTPDASIWRSSVEYDHLDALTASDLAWEWLRRNDAYGVEYDHLDALTASDLAWEWLRRNDAYGTDFEASLASRGDPEPLTEHIRQRWGLRFPGQSADTPT